MKRLIAVLVILILGSAYAFAASVSREDALNYAKKFLGCTDTSELTLSGIGEDGAGPAFYVINRAGGGFVLVSGDDNVDTLLGYSHTGSFTTEGAPDNIKAWTESLAKDIRHVREFKLKPNARDIQRRKAVKPRKAGEGQVVIETAQWDQGGPYNAYCEVGDDGLALTGCVATATAIVLRNNKYPAHGTGRLSGYTTNTKKYYIEGYSIDDHNYNWDLMPLSKNDVRNASAEAKHEIAQLMHDLGVMVGMDYSPGGSGAHTPKMASVLAEHMGYSASAVMRPKAVYTPSQWVGVLKGEIDAGRVVLYSAHDSGGQGGHAFVIDGYDSNGLIRVNWGWSGSGNGFFNLDLAVDGYRFSEDQTALIGLVPDPEGNDNPVSNVIIAGNGVSLAGGSLVKNTLFNVNVSYLTNYGVGTFRSYAIPALVDKEGNILEMTGDPVQIEVPGNTGSGYYHVDVSFTGCRFTKTPAFTDRVAIVLREPATGAYKPLLPSIEDGSLGSLGFIPTHIPIKDNYSAGERFYCSYVSQSDVYTSAVWYFDGVRVNSEFIDLTSGTHEIRLVLGSSSGSRTIVQEINVR